MWIFDSGDTSHMTNNPDGLYNISDCLESVEYGKSESGSISKIKGYLDVKIRNSDGTVNDMTLTDVLYIEDLNCNVISVFSAREKGFKLGESSNGPTLSKGKFILEAYVKLNAGNSYLMGFDVGRVHRNFNLISYQELHNKLGHPGTKKLQNTAKDYNIKIDDFQVEKCESCALAKCRRTNLNKINTNKVENPVKGSI